MLISKVADESAGRGEPAVDIARNCRTASELFELMTKDHDFEAGDDPLTASDLVLLYKNIDLGTQLMSNVRANQYVENVYHDDPETDSDLSESCSSEELRNIMIANKERIDLLTNQGSFNTLCHKLGDLEIQVSNISTDLFEDRLYLNKDPFIKEQLQSLQLMSKTTEIETGLPTSLLDYICCKRLEDNYNFYMDNVITYVTHTIDQLKRISNGDYLPDRVKEKWRESDQRFQKTSKALATPISMRRVTAPCWDDIVRTEVDLRSLVKLLENKVVLEVPRMICGSYKFFSKLQDDKLVISCERKKRAAGSRATPRVDVVLRLPTAPARQLVSNVSPSMLLQPEYQFTEEDCPEVMPIEYQGGEEDALSPRIIELSEQYEEPGIKSSSIRSDEFGSICSVTDDKDGDSGLKEEESNSSRSANRPGSPEKVAQILCSPARVVCAEASSDHATPNNMHFSMINISRQTSLPEAPESTADSFYNKAKKKSPERIRVKSPYENKSYILEERKRRKLLEVRERRERRKLASSDNNKVNKHKAFPQAVSSVTKLSITNKAFYNSIYGRNINGETASRISATEIRGRKPSQKIDGIIQENDLESEGDAVERGDALSAKTIKKLCANHFLDDTETEMSYLQSKHDSDFMRNSTSTSVASNESTSNLFAQADYCPSLTSFKKDGGEPGGVTERTRHEREVKETARTQIVVHKNPANSPRGDSEKAPAIECRRSLEKIYTLMEKLHQIEVNESSKKKAASESRGLGSESRSSLKRRVSFSNSKFEKSHKDIPTAAVPKVVISAKLQTEKTEKEDKERKPKTPRVRTIPESPLKAISQLLHEFDHVQKSRPKIADPKSINRSISTENTELALKLQKRRSRIESSTKEDAPKVVAKVKTRFERVERPESKPPVCEKKIIDLIDEEKEARGEAVRGPPRFSSRLNALAQPKRAYVQAHAEEFPRKQTPERAQRPLSHTPRARRRDGRGSPTSVRAPHSSLERTSKPRHSAVSPEPPDFATLAAAAASALHTLKEKAAPGESAARRTERAASLRTPLLPSNIEVSPLSSSPDPSLPPSLVGPRSASIGIKLHRMVKAMLHPQQTERATATNAPDPTPTPTVSIENIEKEIPTLVNETLEMTKERTENSSSGIEEYQYEARNATSIVNSVSELEMLEHALHRSLSSGTFAGRLRVNKLTLSPRPSLQQVVTHQSGDTTLVLKSSFNQNIKMCCQSDETDLMRLVSTTRLGGIYGFPLQISTVGYAFPAFQCDLKKITPNIVSTDMSRVSDAGTSCRVRELLPVPAVLEVKDNTKSCQCLIAESKSTERMPEACHKDNNIETDPNHDSVSTVSPNVENGGKESSNNVDQENYHPSDYTASFDILVGLLNEIHKITTCSCDGTSTETLDSESRDSPVQNLNRSGDANAQNNCISLYMSSGIESSDDRLGVSVPETKSVAAETLEQKPVCEDKEVLARIVEPDYAPSTSRQAVLSDIANPISTCSVAASTHCEYCDIGCNTLTQPGDKIKETGIETNRSSVKALVPYYNNIFKADTKKDSSSDNCVVQGSASTSCGITVTAVPVQKNKSKAKKSGKVEVQGSKKVGKELSQKTVDFDPTLRVKRDVLVTFYSLLVLTVFAALAFPEMLQYA